MRLVLGLASVACLPLVADTHLLGVLRLGYACEREWGYAEQGLAKQLALILSGSSGSEGGPQQSLHREAAAAATADAAVAAGTEDARAQVGVALGVCLSLLVGGRAGCLWRTRTRSCAVPRRSASLLGAALKRTWLCCFALRWSLSLFIPGQEFL